MKLGKLLLMAFVTCFLLQGIATAATVMTDEQISNIATTAEAGGDVAELASEYMADITADLVAQGLTGDELQAQIAVAIHELTSGLGDAVLPNLETTVADIVSGATNGAITGINQAVGADPNLDADSLTSSVTTGAANAVIAIVATHPTVNATTLQTAVNQAAVALGAPPVEPEAFEPAEETPPEETTGPVTPPAPPAADPVETPPTQDDQSGSPV